jgi:SAM-dependent methyltransferase
MSDIKKYRESDQEKARTDDLVRLLPRGRRSVLDIGARDGHFSQLLTEYFDEVTALDLEKPDFSLQRVTPVAGDATRLQFADNSFDCVFCAEVLEHIPDVAQACREIARVARHEVLVGVPYKQDTRVGRTTCQSCGCENPPWGHVNRFEEKGLIRLFAGLRLVSMSFVWSNREVTNFISAFLMDLAGNPWGTYDQDEPCIHCGARLVAPAYMSLSSKICAGIAARITNVQSALTKPHANWIHMVLQKDVNARFEKAGSG